MADNPTDSKPANDELVDVDDLEEAQEEDGRRKIGTSYAMRMTLSFALVAAMTALVSIVVVSFVWEQHFQTYTRENMMTVAETTAEQIGKRYEIDGAFTANVLQPARYAISTTNGVGMQVVDDTNRVMFDSTTAIEGDASVTVSNRIESFPQVGITGFKSVVT